IAAITPVILEVGVSDAGRGRYEIGPRLEFLRKRVVENDISESTRLTRNGICRLGQLIGEARAFRIHEHRTFLEELERRPERSREEAHEKRPQQPLRHHVHRPRDELRKESRGRKTLYEI